MWQSKANNTQLIMYLDMSWCKYTGVQADVFIHDDTSLFSIVVDCMFIFHLAADEHGLDIYEHNEPAYPAAYTLQGKNHDRSDVGGLAEIGSFEFYGKPIRAHSNGGYIETNFGKWSWKKDTN